MIYCELAFIELNKLLFFLQIPFKAIIMILKYVSSDYTGRKLNLSLQLCYLTLHNSALHMLTPLKMTLSNVWQSPLHPKDRAQMPALGKTSLNPPA